MDTRALKALVLSGILAACAGPSASGGSGGQQGGSGGGSNTGTGGTGTGGTGTGGTGTGGTGTGGLTASQFLDQWDTKDCAEAFMCMATFPATPGDTFADEYGISAAQCQSDDSDDEDRPGIESEIVAGRIHFDPALAAQCLSGIAATPCATYWANDASLTEPDACDTALFGTIADGAACTVDWDCSGDNSICDATTQKCVVDTTALTSSASSRLVGHARAWRLRAFPRPS